MAMPDTAFEGRLLLWHEAPEHVSSLPEVVFLVYVAMDAEAFVLTLVTLLGCEPPSFDPPFEWQ